MDTWERVSFINASKVRFSILVELKEKAKTPKQLADAMEISMSRVSLVLKELSEKGLIECLTPNRRKSKLYFVTEFGKKTLGKIHELTEVR